MEEMSQSIYNHKLEALEADKAVFVSVTVFQEKEEGEKSHKV